MFLILQPERIDPQSFGHGYDVRSDIWSLGIMLVSSILYWIQPASTSNVGANLGLVMLFGCMLVDKGAYAVVETRVPKD